MTLKIYLSLLVVAIVFMPAASAQIQPIVWSESIHKTEKPVTEIFNLSNHMILKSDRTISINLDDKFPIAAIDLRPDRNQSSNINKKDFLFSIRLSDNLAEIINIPFGENKFN